MSNQPTPSVKHTDAYSRDLNRDKTETIPLTIDADDTGGETARFARTVNVTVSHPVDEVAELDQRAHITAQLAAHNSALGDDYDC